MIDHPRLILTLQPTASQLEIDDVVTVAEPRVPGDARRSAASGALFGAAGGLIALALAQGFEDRALLSLYARAAVGHESSASAGAVWFAIGLSAACGLVAGAALGWLMRRLHGVAWRVMFGAVLVPSIWIAIDAFVLSRFDTRDAEFVPFTPWLVGALAYGVTVALARPVLARPGAFLEVGGDETFERSRRLVHEGARAGTASFLLMRRKDDTIEVRDAARN